MFNDYPYNSDYSEPEPNPKRARGEPAQLGWEDTKGHPNYRRLSDRYPDFNWGMAIALAFTALIWLLVLPPAFMYYFGS